MDKNKVLQEIEQLAEAQQLTEKEVLSAYQTGFQRSQKNILASGDKVGQILYFIGSLIAILGTAILAGQNWFVMSASTRIIITLGFGLGAYVSGVLLNFDNRTLGASFAFFLLSAILMPIGLYVLFHQMGFDITSYSMEIRIAAAMLLVYLLSLLIYPSTLFILFSIVFGTWLFWSVTSLLLSHPPQFFSGKPFNWDPDAYRVLIIGFSYACFGYFFADSRKNLTGFLYSIGIIFFLGAGLVLGGMDSYHNLFWECIYPFLILIVVILSVYLQSNSFLFFGSLFLIFYIFKITHDYFVTSLGWPISLMLDGFAVIVIGFLMVRLHRKYLARKK